LLPFSPEAFVFSSAANVKITIHKTIFLPVVMYGCEILSLTLREGHRLRVFENRVLRRTLGPKRGGMTGGWRKLHNEELHNLYSSPSIIRMIKSRKIRWAGPGEKTNAYRISVGKSEGNRPVGRKRRRWVENIKMYLRDIEWGGTDWTDLAQDRNQWRPWGFHKMLGSS
jgi:hypothetical protein